MIVISIGNIIALIIGGISLIVIGAAYIIYRFEERERKEKKYEIAIGKYDKDLNRKNTTFLIGKWTQEEKEDEKWQK